MAVQRYPLRWLVGAVCLAGLGVLGGCAGAANIGLPMGGPTASTPSADQEAVATAETLQPAAQAYAAPGDTPIVAEGDADPEVAAGGTTPQTAAAPWQSLDRWSDGSPRLLTTEEVDATQQTLRERAAAQLRQTLEIISLRSQRAAAQEVVANAVQRTADVLSGITGKCRTGQADEACAEEPGAPSAPAAQ